MVYIQRAVSDEAVAESALLGLALENKYRIIRLIGQGGMGEVFEAEHTGLGKRVAIKLLLEKYASDGEALARFQREALAASRIGDPHIIDVMDIGTAPDGRSFVVMELLSGMSLAQAIEQGPMEPVRALAIMRQVLRAVGAAHAKGIVHRDLKPDNIYLLDDKGETRDFVKLLDFGISKVIDPDTTAAATKLTTTGVVMGTPLYMAPEQAMGHEIDHQADLYACGVILYEMLGGQPPFDGSTYAVLVAKLLTSEPPLLSTIRPELPGNLVAAVHQALAKEPRDRFESADAFLGALAHWASAPPVPAATPTPSPASTPALLAERGVALPPRPVAPTTLRTRGRARAMWLAGAIAIVGAVVAIVVLRSGADPRADEAPTRAPAGDPKPTPGSSAAPVPVPTTTGTIEIGSEPQGATVVIDDVERGTTPITLTLPTGEHSLVLRLDGHEPVTRTERIEPGIKRSILPWLRPSKDRPRTSRTGSGKPPGPRTPGSEPALGERNPYDDDPPKAPPAIKPPEVRNAPPSVGSSKDNPYLTNP